jgi:hypothetical protein
MLWQRYTELATVQPEELFLSIQQIILEIFLGTTAKNCEESGIRILGS